MQPRKFFETGTRGIPSNDGITLIGPVGADLADLTHQMAITMRGTTDPQTGREQESVTVWTANTDPHDDDALDFTFTLEEGSEPQVEDIHSGETGGDEPDLHLRDVATFLGTASIKIFASDHPEDVNTFVGSVQSTRGNFITELHTAVPADVPYLPDHVTADMYEACYEEQDGR